MTFWQCVWETSLLQSFVLKKIDYTYIDFLILQLNVLFKKANMWSILLILLNTATLHVSIHYRNNSWIKLTGLYIYILLVHYCDEFAQTCSPSHAVLVGCPCRHVYVGRLDFRHFMIWWWLLVTVIHLRTATHQHPSHSLYIGSYRS